MARYGWYPDAPVTQIEADVPIEPLALQAEAADLELALHSYERPPGSVTFWHSRTST